MSSNVKQKTRQGRAWTFDELRDFVDDLRGLRITRRRLEAWLEPDALAFVEQWMPRATNNTKYEVAKLIEMLRNHIDILEGCLELKGGNN